MNTGERSTRKQIELGFERWGRAVCRHPWIAALLPALLTLGLASLAVKLKVDTSHESFLHPSSPARVLYDGFRDQFGRDDVAIVVVHPPEIFDLGFLLKLRDLHEAMERELPYLEKVTSLINARWTRGHGDELIVEDLFASWPSSPAELEDVRERALAHPLYRNYLLSADASHTTLLAKPLTHSPGEPGGAGSPSDDGEIAPDFELDALAGFDSESRFDSDLEFATESGSSADTGGAVQEAARRNFLSDAETEVFVRALLDLVDRYRAADFEIAVAGNPIIAAHTNASVRDDMGRFGAISMAIVAALLLAVFRRVAGVLIPLVVVGSALVSTLGCMVALDIPMSMPVQILPTLLLTVGVCGAVHILVIYYQSLDAGMQTADAVAAALGHSGLAIFFASFTTAAGLLSFLSAELAIVAHIGIVGPLGVALCFLYVIVLLPALLMLMNPTAPRWRAPAQTRGVGRLLARTGSASSHHPYRVLLATALILVLGLLGVLRLRVSQDFLDWFPDGDRVEQATRLVDAEFRGVTTLEVVLDTGRRDGLYEPETLRRIEAAMRHAEGVDEGPVRIGKAISVVDILKETHRALNQNDPDHYTLPDHPSAVAQELLLFSSSGVDDLEELVDSEYRKARIAMRATYMDAIEYPPFIEKLASDLREIMGDEVEVQLTGLMVLLSQSISAVVETMARSYLLALIVITPTMILLIGDLRLGLLSMIPNLIPVFLTLGLMGWLGIPLETSNLIVGSLVLGLAVDDTIHFFHKFKRYLEETGDRELAIRRTLETTGAALLTTSLVLAAGFASFLFAYMLNAVQLGLLAAFATLTAFIADVVLAPALVSLLPEASPLSADTAPDRAS